MDVQFYGANCVAISVGGARVIIDDTLADMGGKSVFKPGDIALYTQIHATMPEKVSEKGAPAGAKIVIDRPGEYEVADISVYGIQARGHMDEDKQRTSVMYKLIAKDVRVLVTGHVFPKLKESELEAIGTVDVMVVPVGGNGYTLDPTGALSLIKAIEPKVVIPTYYADDKLTFPMPAQTLDQALQGLGMEPKERTSKLRLKAGDWDATIQLVIVEKS